jgi:glycine cleavage system transcriptional repressor
VILPAYSIAFCYNQILFLSTGLPMEHLSIATLGLNQAKSVSLITDTITKYECNIIRSHMQKLGSDFTMTLLVCGSWNSIAKLESALQILGNDLNIAIIAKRTEVTTNQVNAIPYNIQVIGVDDSALIREIIAFFYDQNINIEDLHIETTTPQATGTTIIILNGLINIPINISIASLREQYLSLCDELNVDGMLEPERRL